MKIKILAFIAILFLGGLSYAVYAGVSYMNTPKTPEEIELQKTARLLEAQTKIDMDNLKILSDCHEYAETKARYPDELIVIRDECYNRGKYPDVLKGEINENGDKSYSGTLTAGSTAVPHSSKIIYEKKDTTLGIEKGVSDDTRTGTEGQSRNTGNDSKKVGIDSNNILSILGLDSCRIVQTEDSHIQKGRGSVYAHDIACIRGQSFTVSAPQWKKEYTVAKVGHDPRMGNYIVLQHAKYQFVFGHTESSHKAGDRIPAGEQIGYTDKSGIAENIHLHFELWRDGYNITADEMMGLGSRWNDEHSYALRMQRSWNVGIDKTFDFIVGKEGFRSEAYRDVCRKKDENKNCLEWVWSIGFGTASYPGEVISREEATKRAKDYIAGVIEYTYRLRVGYTENQRVAITSFFYNAGKYRPKMIEVLRSRDAEKIKAQFRSRDYLTPGYEKGLLKRRNAEIDLFFSE